MSRTGLFLISIGCLFILLSYMMPTPLYLIATGLICVIAGIFMVRKDSKSKKENRK